jgi:hypothetical protein
VDNILTYCYHYDPQTNKHSLIVARVVQMGGGLTVVLLGSFMFIMFRRDFHHDGLKGHAPASGGIQGGPTGSGSETGSGTRNDRRGDTRNRVNG